MNKRPVTCDCPAYSFPHRPLSGKCTYETIFISILLQPGTERDWCTQGCRYWYTDAPWAECQADFGQDCPAVRGFLEDAKIPVAKSQLPLSLSLSPEPLNCKAEKKDASST